MKPLTTAAAWLLAAIVSSGYALPAAAAESSPTAKETGIAWLGPRPPQTPQRVISLAPSATDIIIALGRADLLVGVTRYDKAPEVAHLPRIGGFLDPVPEAVLALKPDLAIWVTEGVALSNIQRLADLGVPILALPMVSIADVTTGTRSVARALNEPQAGERLVASLKRSISRTQSAAAHLAKVRVLVIMGREPLVVAGSGTFVDELVRIAGGVNVVQSRRPWPVYPLERAVADDPEMVIDAAVNEHGRSLGPLTTIPAVKYGKLRLLPNDDILRPGPRLSQALVELFRAIHPGLEPP